MRKKRCLYCGKHISKDESYYNIKGYCNVDCKNNYEEFEAYTNKRIKPFGITIAVMIIMLFIGIILSTVNTVAGVILIILGALGVFITFMVFPFATPESVRFLGVKRSILVVRITMVMLMLWIVIQVFLFR